MRYVKIYRAILLFCFSGIVLCAINSLPSNSETYLAVAPEGVTTVSLAQEVLPAVDDEVYLRRNQTNNDGLTLSKFSLTPRLGIYIPLGKDLGISYLGGLDLLWHANNIVNMRLGVEYSEPGIDGGNDLQIFKIPFMLVENENTPEQWGFKKLFYTGIGLVYMNGKFNNIEKQGVGGLFLIGRKFGNKFSAEAKFDAMRKSEGYQFGGISIYLNYTY